MAEPQGRGLKAVIFTDIAGFSALTQKNEAKALSFVEQYREIVSAQTAAFNGEVIHFYGDGSLTLHDSTYESATCAIEMQKRFRTQSIPVRIGIHFGEVVRSEETIYGNAVNIASRLHNLGSPSSILVSGTVANELVNHPDIKTAEIGKQKVKNIDKPVSVNAIVSDGLVIPTRSELRARSRGRTWLQTIAATLVGVALLAVFLLLILPNDFDKRERILIKPFMNMTGDTTLDKYSVIFSSYITNILTGAEDIEIVYGLDLYTDDAVRVMGISDYSLLQQIWQTRNFIVGEFDNANSEELVLRCSLVDGDNGEVVVQFPEQIVSKSQYSQGLKTLTERILGFLDSKHNKTLAPPNQDAYGAYSSAQRLWYDDYDAVHDYLVRAIEYDSTFIDAYFLLTDFYHNRAEPLKADSMVEEVTKRFPIENQNQRKRDYYYYFEAFYTGDNEAAFKYVMNEYERDPRQKFINTSAAAHALYYVNDPKTCLRILNEIKWRKVDYEHRWDIMRINMAIQSNCLLNKYNRAVKFIDYYPQQRIGNREMQLMIRAYAGLDDTSSIEHILDRIHLNQDTVDLIRAMHWTSQQFRVLGHSELAEKYSNQTSKLIEASRADTTNYYVGISSAQLAFETDKYDKGLEVAKIWHDRHPNYPPLIYQLGRAYAHVSNSDSTRYYINELDNYRDLSLWPYRGWVSYWQACIYAASGDDKSALIKLQHAVHSGLEFRLNMMTFDPVLISLHENPEFLRIIHPMDK